MSIHNAVATRPPAYAQLLVDSLDRYVNSAPPTDASGIFVFPTSSSNWTLYLNNNTLNGLFTRLAVTQINFQWNLPTIIKNYNNEFTLVVNPTTTNTLYTITIPEGFYTPTTLATAIQASLNFQAILAGTWTCSFTNFRFIIELTPAPGVNDWIMTPGIQNNSSTAQVIQRCRETCGFSSGAMADNTPLLVHSSGVPSMLPTRFIDIVSSYLTKYQRAKDNTSLRSGRVSNVIARIYPQAPNTSTPLTDTNSIGSQPFNLLIDYNTPKYITWSPDESLASIDFQLVDDLGLLIPTGIDIAGGSIYDKTCEYQMTILATEN
jgi:hypothetical protein